MITTTYKLECTYCGKAEEYTDSYPYNSYKPKNWYRLQPNTEHSEWLTTDFVSIGGDFCTPACIVSHIQETVEINSKSYLVSGDDFPTGKMSKLKGFIPTDGE